MIGNQVCRDVGVVHKNIPPHDGVAGRYPGDVKKPSSRHGRVIFQTVQVSQLLYQGVSDRVREMTGHSQDPIVYRGVHAPDFCPHTFPYPSHCLKRLRIGFLHRG